MSTEDATQAGRIDGPVWDGDNRGGDFKIDGQIVPPPDDADDLATVRHLEGRTIVGAAIEPSEGDFPQGNGVFLQLDDGAILEIAGWGYDSYETDVRYWRGGPS